MRTYLLCFLWFGLCSGMGQVVCAQEQKYDRATDTDITGFSDKQKEILELLSHHEPRLHQLQGKMVHVVDAIHRLDSLMSYRDLVPFYLDSALSELVRLRKQCDGVQQQVKEMNFEWFPYSRGLMAVYTRYGELIAADKVDESLKEFVEAYRNELTLTEAVLAQVQEVYATSEFILNSKLN